MTIEKLLEEFRKYKLDVEGRGKASVDLYERYIRIFLEDMGIDTYKKVVETKANTINQWLIKLAEQGNSASTRNNKLSSVKQLFAFLEATTDENIDRKISRIPIAKTEQKETKYITEDIAEQLVAVTSNQRTQAAIMITMKTGVRFKELIQITCTDIENGYAVVNGKGNKERRIWFPPSCIRYAKKFMNDKREHIIERIGVDTDLLFISDEGTLMTRQSFSTSLKHNAEKIGLSWSDGVSPHKLRHGCVTEALKDGVPVNVVRDMVGHSSIATTNRYAHSEQEQIMSAMLRETREYGE